MAIGKEKPKITAPKSTTVSKTQGKIENQSTPENQSNPEEQKEQNDSKQDDTKKKYRVISSDELKEVQVPSFDPDLHVLLEPIVENHLQIPKTSSGTVIRF